MSVDKGYLGFVLHSHLPYVHHPEKEHCLEEYWFFDALAETYLPLLDLLQKLYEERVPYRLTISLSPTLTTMLLDKLLQERFVAYLENKIALGEKELERNRKTPELLKLSQLYKKHYEKCLDSFENVYKRNLIKGFKALEKAECIDIITTAATHAFLPLYQEFPRVVEAQIHTAVISYGRVFGKAPKGMWIPELGYFPGLGKYLKQHGIDYSYIAAHGQLFAGKKSKYGVYAPVETSSGILAFSRDIPASRAVFSTEDGYPGDQVYRDAKQDIGYDQSFEYIGPHIYDEKIRINTGYKYYRIDTGEKGHLYNPEKAAEKAIAHADNFIYRRSKQAKKLSTMMDRPPMIVCPYDSEIFGKWWYEGLIWLEHVIRKTAESDDLEMFTPAQYVEEYASNEKVEPIFSSWGNKGYASVWLGGANDWIYRHIHKASERMQELVSRFPDESGLKKRVLDQAAREVMLSQASDWPFIMKTCLSADYAKMRVKRHLFNFNKIYDNLCRNTVNTEWLTRIEKENKIFPDLDYRIFDDRDPS
jgi:1,4-alpha-glucan branching enzyme